jgi:hypothetical protein
MPTWGQPPRDPHLNTRSCDHSSSGDLGHPCPEPVRWIYRDSRCCWPNRRVPAEPDEPGELAGASRLPARLRLMNKTNRITKSPNSPETACWNADCVSQFPALLSFLVVRHRAHSNLRKRNSPPGEGQCRMVTMTYGIPVGGACRLFGFGGCSLRLAWRPFFLLHGLGHLVCVLKSNICHPQDRHFSHA